MNDEIPPADELTEQQLLIELNRQNAAIRQQLDQIITLLGDDAPNRESYKCLSCGERVAEDEREGHQIRMHSAPPEGIDLTREYTPL